MLNILMLNAKNKIKEAKLDAAKQSVNSLNVTLAHYLADNDKLFNHNDPIYKIYIDLGAELENLDTNIESISEEKISNIRYLCQFLKRTFE